MAALDDAADAQLARSAALAGFGKPAGQGDGAAHAEIGTRLRQLESRLGIDGEHDAVGHLRQRCQAREARRAEDIVVLRI